MKYVILAALLVSSTAFSQGRGTRRPVPQKKVPVLKVDPKQGLMGDKGNIYKIPNGAGLYGGDAVVCRLRNGKISKVRLLDFAESDIFFPNFTPQLNTNTNYFKEANELATILEKASPDTFISFRKEYLKLLAKFESPVRMSLSENAQVFFVKNLDLINILDSSYRLPTNIRNCKVEQIVIREKKFAGVMYYVQADIFNLLPRSHKRGLALHEAIYHSFNMYYGDDTSERTRFFNRCISNYPIYNLTVSKADHCLKQAFVRF